MAGSPPPMFPPTWQRAAGVSQDDAAPLDASQPLLRASLAPGAAPGPHPASSLLSSPLELLIFRSAQLESAFQAHTGAHAARAWRSYASTALLLSSVHLLLALASYFTTGRILLFFIVAAGVNLIWAACRACEAPSQLLHGGLCFAYMACMATEACFSITSRPGPGRPALDFNAYGQPAAQVELGVAILAVLVPVLLGRVRLSWYLPALGAWLGYYLSMTLAAFPVTNLNSGARTIVVLWAVLACCFAVVCAYRLELLVRMHWYHAAGKVLAAEDAPTAYDAQQVQPPLRVACAPRVALRLCGGCVQVGGEDDEALSAVGSMYTHASPGRGSGGDETLPRHSLSGISHVSGAMRAASLADASGIADSDTGSGMPQSPLQQALELLVKLKSQRGMSAADKATVDSVISILSTAATDLLEVDYTALTSGRTELVGLGSVGSAQTMVGANTRTPRSSRRSSAAAAAATSGGGLQSMASTRSIARGLFSFLFRGSTAPSRRIPTDAGSGAGVRHLLLGAASSKRPSVTGGGTYAGDAGVGATDRSLSSAGSAVFHGGPTGSEPPPRRAGSVLAEAEPAFEVSAAAPAPAAAGVAVSRTGMAIAGTSTAAADLDENTRQWVTSELQAKRARYGRNAPLARTIAAYDSFVVSNASPGESGGGAASSSMPRIAERETSRSSGLHSSASSHHGHSSRSASALGLIGAASAEERAANEAVSGTYSSFIIQSDPSGSRTTYVGTGRGSGFNLAEVVIRRPLGAVAGETASSMHALGIHEPLMEAEDSAREREEGSEEDEDVKPLMTSRSAATAVATPRGGRSSAGGSMVPGGGDTLKSARSVSSLASSVGVEVITTRTNSRRFLLPHKSMERMNVAAAALDSVTGMQTESSARTASAHDLTSLARTSSMRMPNGRLMSVPPAASAVDVFDAEGVVRADALPLGFLPQDAYLKPTPSSSGINTAASAGMVVAVPSGGSASSAGASPPPRPDSRTDVHMAGNAALGRSGTGDMGFVRGRRHSDTSAMLLGLPLGGGSSMPPGVDITTSRAGHPTSPTSATQQQQQPTGRGVSVMGILSSPLQFLRRASEAGMRSSPASGPSIRSLPATRLSQHDSAKDVRSQPMSASSMEMSTSETVPASHAAVSMPSPVSSSSSSTSHMPGAGTAALGASPSAPPRANSPADGIPVAPASVPPGSTAYYVNPKAVAHITQQSEQQAVAAPDDYLQARMNAVARLRGGSRGLGLIAGGSTANLVSGRGLLTRALPSGVGTAWRTSRLPAPAVVTTLPPSSGETQLAHAGTASVGGVDVTVGGSVGGGTSSSSSSATTKSPSTAAGASGSASTNKVASKGEPSSEAVQVPPASSPPGARGGDRDVVERLRVVTQWQFDVFEFAQRCEGRPLAFISYELFTRFHFFEALGVPEAVFTSFINRIERDYCYDPTQPNPYHTNVHAADVVQAVGHFLVVPRLASILDQLDAFSVIVAAIVHDFRHPGVNNNFLIKTADPIALRYNDESVLENFHVAEGFAVMSQPRYNITTGLTHEQRTAARFTIIKTVLATDLAQGGKYVNAFKAKSGLPNLGETDEDKLLVMQMMIKCADVSHPARLLHVHNEWSRLVSDEFYRQGDRERDLGLPISPLCDRTQHNLAKSQQGFINFVVQPAFAAFADFCSAKEWTDQLSSNLKYWKDAANEQAAAATAASAAVSVSASVAVSIAGSAAASHAAMVRAPTLAGTTGKHTTAQQLPLAVHASVRPLPATASREASVGAPSRGVTSVPPPGSTPPGGHTPGSASTPASTAEVVTVSSMPSFSAKGRQVPAAAAASLPEVELPHDVVHVEDSDDDELDTSGAMPSSPLQPSGAPPAKPRSFRGTGSAAASSASAPNGTSLRKLTSERSVRHAIVDAVRSAGGTVTVPPPVRAECGGLMLLSTEDAGRLPMSVLLRIADAVPTLHVRLQQGDAGAAEAV